MDGLLKVGLFAAGGSLLCFVATGDGGLITIWSAVALLLAPLIVLRLRIDAAEAEKAPAAAGNRHHNYVFASETAAPKRRRKVVA